MAEMYQVSCGNFSRETIDFQKPDRWGLVGILMVFSVVTVLGNTLVIVAITIKRYLHTATNCMLASLAIADLIVGLFVMPPNAVKELTGGSWVFGSKFCDIWRSLDVLASTASIWNLCLVSIDRYIGVRDAFLYPVRVTVRKSIIAVMSVWLCSSLISFPAIIWWRHASPMSYLDPCTCEFIDDMTYNTFSSLISFYIPLFIMLFAYLKVYQVAKKYRKSLTSGRVQTRASKGTLRIHRGRSPRGSKRRNMTTKVSIDESTLRKASLETKSLNSVESVLYRFDKVSLNEPVSLTEDRRMSRRPSPSRGRSPSFNSLSLDSTTNPNSIEICSAERIVRRRREGNKFFRIQDKVSSKFSKFSSEQKAAKTLSIVVGCFIICWLPFFILNILYASCPTCIDNAKLTMTIATWLGHCNSCLNPFIYACFNESLRRAFKSILRLRLCRKC